MKSRQKSERGLYLKDWNYTVVIFSLQFLLRDAHQSSRWLRMKFQLYWMVVLRIQRSELEEQLGSK